MMHTDDILDAAIDYAAAKRTWDKTDSAFDRDAMIEAEAKFERRLAEFVDRRIDLLVCLDAQVRHR